MARNFGSVPKRRRGKIPAALKGFQFKKGVKRGKAHGNFKTHGSKMPSAVKAKLRKRGK